MKFILCLLVFIAIDVHAAIGTITELVNKPPSIQRSKNVLIGNKGSGVEMNDSISTSKGIVGIKFEDDTTVQINENSKLVIDDFVYDPKSSKGGHLAVKIALGTVRYASGQIAKQNPQGVAINTPSATIAVRGTDFTATVDELGESTIILLPSCKNGWLDIDKDCKTGIIEVSNSAGSVVLDKPFQATKVANSSSTPSKPVIINLSIDAINNMLIVAPPKELVKTDERRVVAVTGLDQDFLRINSLQNEFDKQKSVYVDKLSKNLLDQDFLANILDIINAQLASQQNLLNTQKSSLLPDYVATSGVIATVDDLSVELCRNDGSNIQCVTTPKNQSSTIYQQQGSIEIKNRVNNGGGTTIILHQN